MSTIIKARPNQSMADLVVQATGSHEAAMQFCSDNNVSLSDVPSLTVVYVVSDAALALGDASVLKAAAQKNILYGNLNVLMPPPALGAVAVLYPLLSAYIDSGAVGIAPSVLGYWNFWMTGTSLGIITEGLPHIHFLSAPNPVAYGNQSVIVAGTLMSIKNCEGTPYEDTYPASGMVNYKVPYDAVSTGTSFVYVQSGFYLDGAHRTFQFEDNDGNVCVCSPFIVLGRNANVVVDCLLPTISIEVVGSSGTSLTLRVTRNHAAIFHPEYANIVFSWTDGAAGGTPDPADPGNVNKTIIACAAGPLTLGVEVQYLYSGDLSKTLGRSKMQMVVMVS